MHHKIAIALIVLAFAIYFVSPWVGMACFILGFVVETVGYIAFAVAEHNKQRMDNAQRKTDGPR